MGNETTIEVDLDELDAALCEIDDELVKLERLLNDYGRLNDGSAATVPQHRVDFIRRLVADIREGIDT